MPKTSYESFLGSLDAPAGSEKLKGQYSREAKTINDLNKDAIEGGTAVAVSAEDISRQDVLMEKIKDTDMETAQKFCDMIASGSPKQGLDGLERLAKGEKL
jgi:hypothetical protein